PSPQDPPFTGKIKDFLLVLWCQQNTRALIINSIRGRLKQNIQIILPYITSRNSHYHSSLNIPRGYWRTFSFVALPQYPHQSQLPAQISFAVQSLVVSVVLPASHQVLQPLRNT